MACSAHSLPAHHPFRAGSGAYAVPVIADRGDDAWVVLVRFPAAPRVGDRFSFDSITWELVRDRDHARGYVARPAGRRTDRRAR